ncbi:YT521-B-like domain-containing protein, partial [Amylostereum chailletii]
MGYSPSVARREGGYAQGQPISPTVPSPASPRRHPAQTSWVGGSQTSTREDLPSPAPAVTASPERPKLGRAMSSLSEPERVSGRQAYHPNPPAQRSEWVMWAGNVPSDATHDELWRFFNQPLLPSPSPSEPDASSSAQTGNAARAHGGVSSIFLISRSNCAFVNFETEKHLQTATARFNGQPIRPNDPRCPRLVCRVRRRTDDLKAGVGGQRGLGMHTKWVKEQKTRMSAARTQGGTGSPTSPDTSSPEDELAERYSGLSMSDDEGGRRRKGTSEPIPPADVRKEQLLPVQEELAASNPVTPAAADADTEPEEVWGQPFRIEWIKTDRLPFYRTRHLRNPWNHGREVKVSRDGTELEPTLGKELLEEWD